MVLGVDPGGRRVALPVKLANKPGEQPGVSVRQNAPAAPPQRAPHRPVSLHGSPRRRAPARGPLPRKVRVLGPAQWARWPAVGYLRHRPPAPPANRVAPVHRGPSAGACALKRARDKVVAKAHLLAHNAGDVLVHRFAHARDPALGEFQLPLQGFHCGARAQRSDPGVFAPRARHTHTPSSLIVKNEIAENHFSHALKSLEIIFGCPK